MPYSSTALDNKIVAFLKKIKPKKVYDLGAGAGKYGLLIKENIPQIETCIAMEIDKNYIKKFHLANIYTEIINDSINNLIRPKYLETNFDTIIIGDCIEHLKKSEGIDLLNFLVYRSKWIIIQFPIKYLQNSFKGKHQEAHISVWDKKDFQSFEINKYFSSGSQRCVMIKGYL